MCACVSVSEGAGGSGSDGGDCGGVRVYWQG